MEILLEKVKADKKLVVAMNLNLSEEEAEGFWPVYDSYQADLEHVNQRLGQLVSDYADAYNSASISEPTNHSLQVQTLLDDMQIGKTTVEDVGDQFGKRTAVHVSFANAQTKESWAWVRLGPPFTPTRVSPPW